MSEATAHQPTSREELLHLVEVLPEDQLPAALAAVRHLAPRQSGDDTPTEPPEFFGSFDSGDPYYAERSEEILRAEFPR